MLAAAGGAAEGAKMHAILCAWDIATAAAFR
jgi:hypothetical protein